MTKSGNEGSVGISARKSVCVSIALWGGDRPLATRLEPTQTCHCPFLLNRYKAVMSGHCAWSTFADAGKNNAVVPRLEVWVLYSDQLVFPSDLLAFELEKSLRLCAPLLFLVNWV